MPLRHANSPDPERRLRVGFVSRHLRSHPVGYFLAGFVREHDPGRIELHAYSNSREDWLTRELRQNIEHWNEIGDASDAELARRIVDDRVDVLFDVSGLEAHNLGSLFAMRLAPVQVTGFGHFSTTGRGRGHYLLADRFHTPDGFERYYSEEVVCLPHSYISYSAGLRELVAAGAMTGCRLGELTGAKVRDLDQQAAMLRVRGKTGHREVPLPSSALLLFRQLASGRRPDEVLLLTDNGEAWRSSAHTRPFAAAVERAGLDPATTFYALRHTNTTRMLKAGVPTQAVAEHHGTSARMIELNYAKFVPSDRARYAAMGAPASRWSRNWQP